MIAISIIIPVGAKHHEFVGTAITSCMWQTVVHFEVIVINDAPTQFEYHNDPRVIVLDSPNRFIPAGSQVGNRAAVARNHGIKHARGEYILCLDADDYLLPTALEILLRGQMSHNSYYTYSSHYVNKTHMRPPDYNQQRQANFNLHPITALVPRAAVVAVGGFDESAPGWEDWTLWLRLAIAGYCGEYINGPVFVYRDTHSINHFIDVAGGQLLMDKVIAPYRDKSGAITMARCCGGGSDRRIASAVVGSLPAIPVQSDGMALLEYIGPMQGAFMLRHPDSGRTYKAGRNASVRFINVPVEDTDYLLSMSTFRRVMPSAPYVEPPQEAPLQINEPLTTVLPIPSTTAQEPPQATIARNSDGTTMVLESASLAAFMAEVQEAMPYVNVATTATPEPAPVKRGRPPNAK